MESSKKLNFKRTKYCAEFNLNDANKDVVACGWVAKKRDLGPLIFIDLRDRSGIVQLAFDENTNRNVFEKAKECRPEFVICASGTVKERSNKNLNLKTGEI